MKMPKSATQGRLVPEIQTSNHIPPPALATYCPSDCSTNGSPPHRQESDRSPTYGPRSYRHTAVVDPSENPSGSEHESRNEHARVEQDQPQHFHYHDQSDTRAQVGTRGQEVPHHRRHSSRYSPPSPHVRMSGDEHSPEASGSARSQPCTSNEHILEFLASLEAKKQRCSPHSQSGGTSRARSPELENRTDDNKADEPSTVEQSDGDAAKKSPPTQPRRSIRFDPVITTYGGASGPESGTISPPGPSAPVQPYTLQLPMESMLDEYGDLLPLYR